MYTHVMRKQALFSVIVATWTIGASAVLVRCVGGDDTTKTDAGADATTDAPPSDGAPPDAGFTLSLTPSHLTEDIGDSFQVTVNVNRSPSFNDPVTFAVSAPPNLTATTPNPATTTSTFFVTANSGAGDFVVTVTGTSGTLLQNAVLGVRVGSVIAPDDAGVLVIPAYASSLTIKAWGGAGGGGPDCTYISTLNGATGGGGGFAGGVLAVNPGDTYHIAVGAGGAGTSMGSGGGGGGGGYSAFVAGDGGVILLAGGGGGGLAAYCPGSSGTIGLGGGAGGGITGGTGGGLAPGTGGAPDGGGKGGGANGGALMGGSGGGAGNISGGTPGGGNGSSPQGGGGGGGGYFGGGGGAAGGGSLNGGGGGGGCGWNTLDGGTLIEAAGAGAANSSDPDYANNAGTSNKGGGNQGRVVIRLSKP